MRARLALLGLMLTLSASAIAAEEGGFLAASDWQGLDGYWTVKGDTVVGESKEPLKFNTFLCSKKKYGDFELSFEVRLKNAVGNSGVQIRSKIHDEKHLAVTGPQCDIGGEFWGSLYGEHFGGMLKAAPKEVVTKVLKKDDFNKYEIKAVGKHITIKLNGETTVDQEFPTAPAEGIIAWQLHAGPAMEVTFRGIKFKELK